MSIDRFNQIIDLIESKGKNYTIDFFGGEPLLNPEIDLMFIRINASPSCTRATLFTNAISLTNKRNKEINMLFTKLTLNIRVSFDPVPDSRGYDLILKNPEILEVIKNDNVTVAFSVHKRGKYILKDYQYLLKYTKNIDWYFNRNYWEWTQKDLDNFQKGFTEFMVWYRTSNSKLPPRLKNYFEGINNSLNDSLNDSTKVHGCGGGITSLTFNITEDNVSCGVLDLKPKAEKVPSQESIKNFCAGCSIEKVCPKTCPLMVQKAGQDNAICKIHKIIIAGLLIHEQGKLNDRK